MKSRILFAMASIAICAWGLPAYARGGHETENGGSVIVVDGDRYELADLHFQEGPYETLVFDPELKGMLKSIEKAANETWSIWFARGQDSSRVYFFPSSIFSDRVEYRFVSKLPDGCGFIPQENLPPDVERINIGCTKGSTTYLLPKEFARLDLLQKALLIIHERLHAFAPDEAYDLKTGLVTSLYHLMHRYWPALQAKDTSFRFTDEELRSVNRFGYFYNRLFGGGGTTKFLSTGAILRGDSKIVGENIELTIGTQIGWDNFPMTINGKNIRIENSRISGERIVSPNLSGENIIIRGSTFNCDRTRLNDAEIDGSQISVRTLDARKVSILRSKIGANLFQGQSIRIEDSDLTIGHNKFENDDYDPALIDGIIAEDLQILRSKAGRSFRDTSHISATIQGSKILITDSEFSGLHLKDTTDVQILDSEIQAFAECSPNLFICHVGGILRNSGRGLRIERSKIHAIGRLIGDEIVFKDSEVSNLRLSLEGRSRVSILNSKLATTQGVSRLDPDKGLTLDSDLILRNIGRFLIDDFLRDMEIGIPGKPLTLDGQGAEFRVDSDVKTIQSQADLDKFRVRN